ncbi:MAG: hypothetical protein ACOC1K_01360 [Nanoarchaeota archaeon]
MFEEFNNDENLYMKEDKIINNSYNTGDINYEAFTTPMRVSSRVESQYEDQLSENMIERRTIKMLEEELYELFKASPFYEKYKNPKRVDKNDMIKMYYYFKERLLKKKSFSPSEIFKGFGEFFQINYNQLYDELGVLDKESLLKELNDKYSFKNKIKNKRLF